MCGVELVPVERLKPADYNPRRADAERLALVRLSLSRLGFLLPIVATPDGEILSGHQRHAVAMSMGARQVPVMFVDIPQELGVPALHSLGGVEGGKAAHCAPRLMSSSPAMWAEAYRSIASIVWQVAEKRDWMP